MLNARKKLSGLGAVGSGPDLYHSPISSGGSSPGSWRKITEVLRFHSTGLPKGDKRVSENRMGRFGSQRSTIFTTPGLWESDRKATHINTDIASYATEDAHPMSAIKIKENRKVSLA